MPLACDMLIADIISFMSTAAQARLEAIASFEVSRAGMADITARYSYCRRQAVDACAPNLIDEIFLLPR